MKYKIKCCLDSWLSKPGMVIYVEKDYLRCTNDVILLNLQEMEYLANCVQLTFVYIPIFLNRCSDDLYEFMTGKVSDRIPLLSSGVPLESIIGSDIFEQIQGPSLLFTGADNHGCCEAYTLPLERSTSWPLQLVGKKRYYCSVDSLRNAFRMYASEHGFPAIISFKRKDTICFRCVPEDEETDSDQRNGAHLTDRQGSSPFGSISINDEEKMVRDKAQRLIAKLLEEGFSQEAIWSFFAPEQIISRILITDSFDIVLPDYDNLKIPLPAVQKAVYFLFLKHPEGINFKDLYDYRNELFQIYRKIAQRGTTEKLAATVDDLVNPLSNAMNEKCSRIKNMFCYYLTDNLAKHYYIFGNKGDCKRIEISSSKVRWMKEI